MSAADRAAVSEQLAQQASSSAPGGSSSAGAAVPAQAQPSQPDAGLRLHPPGQAARSAGPAADAASAATAAAAPIVAAAAAAAAAGNIAAGRVYHALYRGRPGSTASASGAQTPADLAELLVPGQASRRGCLPTSVSAGPLLTSFCLCRQPPDGVLHTKCSASHELGHAVSRLRAVCAAMPRQRAPASSSHTQGPA